MFPNRTLSACLTLMSPLRVRLWTLQGYSSETDEQCEGLKINGGDGNRKKMFWRIKATDTEEKQHPTENRPKLSNSCKIFTMFRGRKIKY